MFSQNQIWHVTISFIYFSWTFAVKSNECQNGLSQIVTIYVLSHVLSCLFISLVSSFPVLFWKITNFPLLFQVSCPSSHVKCLIVFPDSQSVSTCSPWSLVCSNSLRLPVSCASMLRPVPTCITHVLNHSHSLASSLQSSDSPAERIYL